MIVTNVLASHYAQSYVHQLMASFNQGASQSSDDVVTYDLYAMGFNPVMHGDDFNQFLGGSLPKDVLEFQERVQRSNVLTFFYPIWWNDMPAIMKGWIDRVFAKGFAYDVDENGERGLLTVERVLLVCTLGNSGLEPRHQQLEQAMRTKEELGVFGYCGVSKVDHYFLHDVYSSPEKRATYLNDVRDMGKSLKANIGSHS